MRPYHRWSVSTQLLSAASQQPQTHLQLAGRVRDQGLTLSNGDAYRRVQHLTRRGFLASPARGRYTLTPKGERRLDRAWEPR